MIYTITLNPAVDRELTVPTIQFDTVLRSTAVRVDFGGKGFNVSRTLRALGTASTALGFVGGKSGELLQAGLEAMGIATDFIPIDGDTRTNISVVTEGHGRYIKVNEPGPSVSPAAQSRLLDRVASRAQPGDWWVLAGSLPPGVPDTYYADLIRLIQAAGGYAILDTSGPALRAGCAAEPFLVKPNAAEAAQMTECAELDEDGIVTAGMIQNLGPHNVIISRGRDGAVLADGEARWRAIAPAIQERNPTGAGDALVGGLIWGLSRGETLPEALRQGVASGAAAAGESGTAVGTQERIIELAQQVSVERLNR